MKHRFVTFGVDVWRFTPLAAVAIAVLVNAVNLRNVLDGQLSALDGLARFALAFFLALVAVGGISRMLIAYAHQLAQSEHDAGEDKPGSPHTWIGLCYIADQRTLTFASATKIIAPSGAARSWQATCYQATLATPMPAPWRPVPRRRAAGRKPGQFRHNRLRLAEVLHRCEVAKDESRA